MAPAVGSGGPVRLHDRPRVASSRAAVTPAIVQQHRLPAAPESGLEARGEQPVLVGTVIKVIDGDTIKVRLSSGPNNVRFDAIDAPEKDQPGGAEASAALSSRLSGQVIALDVVMQDRYARLVAVVYLGDENINAWMVKHGHAWAYREYLKDQDYCVWEGAARAARSGL